ncbi:hypothetical protein [Thermoproteus tenax]|nr:hypothetical protein [Thermoproteus tenax]
MAVDYVDIGVKTELAMLRSSGCGKTTINRRHKGPRGRICFCDDDVIYR